MCLDIYVAVLLSKHWQSLLMYKTLSDKHDAYCKFSQFLHIYRTSIGHIYIYIYIYIYMYIYTYKDSRS